MMAPGGGGLEVWFYSSFNFVARLAVVGRGGGVNATLRPVWTAVENRSPPGFDPRIVQSVADDM